MRVIEGSNEGSRGWEHEKMNVARFRQLIEKFETNREITVGFIGGSITQGSLASVIRKSYAARVYAHLSQVYPKHFIRYVNAGIGGTNSYFGAARVEEDLLSEKPDLVFVEFGVNDEANSFYQETYEGLIRKILTSEAKPAVIGIHSVYYDSGRNAYHYHEPILRHYQIPSISMKDTIYQRICSGELREDEVTPDHLHPSDFGHQLMAEQIIGLLEQVFEVAKGQEGVVYELPTPYTKNRFQNLKIINNLNSKPYLAGFLKDNSKKTSVSDNFRNGWVASSRGAYFEIELETTQIAVLYRKSVRHPAPIARMIVDDHEEIILDGNFTQDWGDCLYLQTLATDLNKGMHHVCIELIDAPFDAATSFYLVAFIVDQS